MGLLEYIDSIVSNDYEVRLLKNEDELKEYQKLRLDYLLADFDPKKRETLITDDDGYDKDNSQLCVFYTDPVTKKKELVGGYLFMKFKNRNSFCKTAIEYDLSKLLDKHWKEVLEISRLVIHPYHRNGIVLRLLWDGIVAYVKKFGLRYLIGITSFHGTDPTANLHASSYVYYNYLMPEDIRVTAVPGNFHKMNLLEESQVDKDLARLELPPILRGYLTLGAKVGNGHYVDYDYKSVDIFTFVDLQNYCREKLK